MAKKKGLGKGLESLISESTTEVGRKLDDTSINIDLLVPNPDQPRREFKEEALNELSDSIRQNGIIQPILVRKKGAKYEIIAGERRFQAAKLAGLEEVPVVIRDISDEDVFKIALIENLQRSDLNPIEEAAGYKKLLEQKDITQKELGELLSKSRSAITNAMRLLDLPNDIQEMVVEGLISAGHARAILAVPTEEGRIKLAERVIKDKLSVRQTENLAPLFSGIGTERPQRTSTPQSYKRVARELRVALGTNVKVKCLKGKNKIEIDFKDEGDLERIVDFISNHREKANDYE